jgi:hypothetical protein
LTIFGTSSVNAQRLIVLLASFPSPIIDVSTLASVADSDAAVVVEASADDAAVVSALLPADALLTDAVPELPHPASAEVIMHAHNNPETTFLFIRMYLPFESMIVIHILRIAARNDTYFYF